MKPFIISLVLLSTAVQAQAENPDLNGVISRLATFDNYSAAAEYEILPPNADSPIIYALQLASHTNQADTIALASYLIDWTSNAASPAANGFYAYFDGNYYRFKDKLLKEYHITDDKQQMTPLGDILHGIQNQSQFCELLPQYISRTLDMMQTDSTYSYSITESPTHNTLTIDGSRRFNGITAQKYAYVFDYSNMHPLQIEIENNPDEPNEQSISVKYNYSSDLITNTPDNEDALKSIYPEAFSKYRQKNISPENLTGRRLPDFSAPTISGDRYTFDRKSNFETTTVIAILDGDAVGTSNTVNEIRTAVSTSKSDVAIIFAFINSNHTSIEDCTGNIMPNEQVLINTRGLARDCGASSTPTVLVCDPSATIRFSSSKFNNDLGDFVIQSIKEITD